MTGFDDINARTGVSGGRPNRISSGQRARVRLNRRDLPSIGRRRKRQDSIAHPEIKGSPKLLRQIAAQLGTSMIAAPASISVDGNTLRAPSRPVPDDQATCAQRLQSPGNCWSPSAKMSQTAGHKTGCRQFQFKDQSSLPSGFPLAVCLSLLTHEIDRDCNIPD
ncbi:hypothetical protein NKH63_18200 [Mesorhizobium sp. M0960]|uniref:hypothetical protein n=1 Tax=Mesorhizobium sp. M0960 TaxID=2957035 RepID=UPI003336D26C